MQPDGGLSDLVEKARSLLAVNPQMPLDQLKMELAMQTTQAPVVPPAPQRSEVAEAQAMAARHAECVFRENDVLKERLRQLEGQLMRASAAASWTGSGDSSGSNG